MQIQVLGIKAETIIGIHIHERKTKQPVFINLNIELKDRPREDEISTTLDYETLTNEITAYVEGTSYNLIESLVDDVLDIIMKHEIVKHAKVEIEKPQALMTAKNVIVSSTRTN
jgi:FolB domain-containing protein